jgi:CubicO group peptidase (beta-lactamase class C family)
MLRRIAERVGGKPLATLLRTMVFKPLGMNQSSYPPSNRLPRPFRRGYTIQGSELGNALDARPGARASPPAPARRSRRLATCTGGRARWAPARC